VHTPPRRELIRHLDPLQDAQRIVHLIACYEFPWDMTRSLELALFRTFCVPEIADVLDRTGKFQSRAQRRYDDTDILISTLLERGYDSEAGSQALQRINRQHGRFDIPNEQFLYVLSTFIYEPIRWNRRFGWRTMGANECQALFYFWRAVGQRMGIRDIPPESARFEEFNRRYESEHFRYADSNQRIGNAVLAMFCSWFPGFLNPLVRVGMLSLLDPSVRSAFGFATPPGWIGTFVRGSLRLRAWLLKVSPKRRQPRLRSSGRRRSYPTGHSLDGLDPEAR
jgi:hypothetical protein